MVKVPTQGTAQRPGSGELSIGQLLHAVSLPIFTGLAVICAALGYLVFDERPDKNVVGAGMGILFGLALIGIAGRQVYRELSNRRPSAD